MSVCGVVAKNPLHVKLYPDGVPSVNGLEDVPESITEKGYFTNVSDPELLVYLPDKSIATGQAMLVVPGGSYKNVCTPREGDKTAEWLNSHGVAAMVLKYRMPNGHPELPLED
ncbi:MAG: alpha/beta hydrolase, partial [Muribaculaceae bacterium]|nr:alpha/beta hydrolase [Muribaculaceae bacterium]